MTDYLPAATRPGDLPSRGGPPPRTSWELLTSGGAPLAYLPESSYERPAVTAALQVMYGDPRQFANMEAWENLLSAAGTAAAVYVYDRHGERYKVLRVDPYPGGESGELVVQHVGPRGTTRVDIHRAFGYILPVVAYKPTRHGSGGRPYCSCCGHYEHEHAGGLVACAKCGVGQDKGGCSGFTRGNHPAMNPAKDDGRYAFQHPCTGSTYDDMRALIDSAQKITRGTFVRKIGAEQWQWLLAALGYDRHVPIARDRLVGYYRGVYCGVSAVFMRHSGTEYIFTLEKQPMRNPSGDERLRDLQRRAAQGDPAAAAALEAAGERARPRRWLEDFQVTIRGPHFVTRAELEALPSLSEGHFSDMKYGDAHWRIFVVRGTPTHRHGEGPCRHGCLDGAYHDAGDFNGDGVEVERRATPGEIESGASNNSVWIEVARQDQTPANMLVIAVDNERWVHDYLIEPLRRSLIADYLRGQYDPVAARDAWRHVVARYVPTFERANALWHEEPVSRHRVPRDVIEQAADELAERFERSARDGEYEQTAAEVAASLPAKREAKPKRRRK